VPGEEGCIKESGRDDWFDWFVVVCCTRKVAASFEGKLAGMLILWDIAIG
jgi:hypothetical protein